MTLISNISRVTPKPEVQQELLKSVFRDWYVECSVTGDKISLDRIKYWSVSKQEVYSSPEVMPLWDEYERIDREEFLNEIEKRLGPKKERSYFISEKYGKIIC
jgi:hypothetical protein